MYPPVRAIANLLADAAPAELERLRKQFPDQTKLFETFFELGDKPRNAALSDRQLEALRAFIEAGLAAAEGKLGRLIKALTDRIRRARMTKLAGAIIASVSSVGVVSALALDKTLVAALTAILGLVSSLASIVGEHLAKPVVGTHKGLDELLASALKAEAMAGELRLSLLAGRFGSSEETIVIARKVNELAAQIREIVVFGGITDA